MVRVIPVMDQAGPDCSDNEDRKHLLERRWGRGTARDKNRRRETRRQGAMVAQFEKAALMAKRAELILVREVKRTQRNEERDQERQALAKQLGLSASMAAYLPPTPIIEKLREQHQRARALGAHAAMNKSRRDFWADWLAAAQAPAVTMKALR